MLTSSTQPALASLECRREPSGSTSRVTGYTHQTLVIIGALQPRALFVFAVKSCYVGDGPLQSDVTALHDLESERALPRLRAQFSARTGTPIQGGKFLQANNSRAHAFTDVTERNPNEILWCLPPLPSPHVGLSSRLSMKRLARTCSRIVNNLCQEPLARC